MKRKNFSLWRRIGQCLFFLLFLFLFIKTDYAGSDTLTYTVNILFRINPFLAACAMLAAKTFITLLIPAAATILLTFLLGRFFCGWVCPMGAILDLTHKLMSPPGKIDGWQYRKIRYYILFFLLAAAFFGLPIAGYIDPFSILVRALTVAVFPAFNTAAESFFTFTYTEMPAWINSFSEPLYALLRENILAADPRFYTLSLLSLFLLLLVVLLEQLERRFFCRNLCPLGAMLSLVSSVGLLGIKAGGGSGVTLHGQCGKCQSCRRICRMAAIDAEKKVSKEKCTLCLDCIDICPKKQISFQAGFSTQHGLPNLSRRGFITAVAGGFGIPLFLPSRALSKRLNPKLIRPPGAMDEKEFLSRCVRCGECMKVCIANGLHPVFLDAGLEGIFSPKLLPRIGYCEYGCSLCGQVCPTGAIKELKIAEKKKVKIGTITFDKNRCLPFAKATPCIVCEEHCPTPDKAIKFRDAAVVDNKGEKVTVKQPYLVDDLCIGCGICENKCPLKGPAAVHVSRVEKQTIIRPLG